MNGPLAPLDSSRPRLALLADLRAARAGSVDAFERVIEATQRMVTAIALTVVRDPWASEAIASDVYVETWRGLARDQHTHGFLVALRQRTRGAALTFARVRRQDRRRPEAPSGASARAHAEAPLTRAVSEEERRIVADAIDALPETLREVLTVFYREERSLGHVAELLGATEEAVRGRLVSARSLRDEELTRFERVARRTSPTATFTSSVVNAIRNHPADPKTPDPVARRVAFALNLLSWS